MSDEDEARCTSCGVPFTDHVGIIGTCADKIKLLQENVKLKSQVTILRVEIAHMKAADSKHIFKKE